MPTSKLKIIRELEKSAEIVKKLKADLESDGRRQKRPIVIEFSGAPKSGKTSCINSLEMFLKRNDFHVKIIQERAGICPVNDKESPMFNIWTSCMSITGMLSVLENELESSNCDILILDRGIFDALCWLTWMTDKQKMEASQQKVIENFLLMDELVKRIDIVFSFTVQPEISIEREYANLLTKKTGRIMKPIVLSEFLSAIKKTNALKSKYFHNIFSIDTSNKKQDDVGKEVTETILNALMNMLMERVGYFKLEELFNDIPTSSSILECKNMIGHLPQIEFDLRGRVEDDDTCIQPIPILVLANKDLSKVLTVKKAAKATNQGSPEKDKLLLYVGGHCRFEDATTADANDFLSICRFTLKREIQEEIGLRLALDGIEPFFIYSPTSTKSKKHLAVCFFAAIDIENIKLKLDSYELVQNKGTTQSGRFQTIDSLLSDKTDIEEWSTIILERCFNAKRIRLFE